MVPGDVASKDSKQSRTGNSFSKLREKVINRLRQSVPEALPAVGGEDLYDVLEHCQSVFEVLSGSGTVPLPECKKTNLRRTGASQSIRKEKRVRWQKNETGAPQDVGLRSYLNGITIGTRREGRKAGTKSRRVVCGLSNKRISGTSPSFEYICL